MRAAVVESLMVVSDEAEEEALHSDADTRDGGEGSMEKQHSGGTPRRLSWLCWLPSSASCLTLESVASEEVRFSCVGSKLKELAMIHEKKPILQPPQASSVALSQR